MKNIQKTLFALMGTTMLLMAFQCGELDKETTLDEYSYNAHHSKCLFHTDAIAKSLENNESVEVKYRGDSVHVIHHNLMVNCGTAEMERGIRVVACNRHFSTIDIYELEDENNPQADCLCEVDNEFDLYGLERGTYTFVFHNWSQGPHSETVTF